MRRKHTWISLFLVMAMGSGLVQPTFPVNAQEAMVIAEENGVTVTTASELEAALAQKKSLIIVQGSITMGKEADATGRMLPLMIPEGTVIRGEGAASLDLRCPIQLTGDDVCFQNIGLLFSSGTALGSVPHREIFLAGHSLTLDNVNTYLEGSGGSLGGIGGSEAELLPTVYAGGFSDTSVGNNASLTVINANKDADKDIGTYFQAIHMGNDAGTDNKVSYTGTSVLNLDCRTEIRNGIYTDKNRTADITINGNGYMRDLEIYGNLATNVTLVQSDVTNASLINVGHLILEEEARLQPAVSTLHHVTLKNGARLDFSELDEMAVITGDFTGADMDNEEKGVLILDSEGLLTIQGTVTGVTQFETDNYYCNGEVYIYAEQNSEEPANFVLSQEDENSGYELFYEKDGWKIGNIWVPEKIEILSSPEMVNLDEIGETSDGSIPNEESYFEVAWYNAKNDKFSDEDVEYDMLYSEYCVIPIKTEYWENLEENSKKTDGLNDVYLMSLVDGSGKYYICAGNNAQVGEYTFLFCSGYYYDYSEYLDTVADVAALKDIIKAEAKVTFYDSTTQPHEHLDENNDGICDKEGCEIRTGYRITLYSATRDGEATSVAALTGGGVKECGKEVTVTAQKKNGYRFIGWYQAAEDGYSYTGEVLSNSLSYTFTPETDVELVAIYEANSYSTLSISGNGYTVTHNNIVSAIQNSTYRESFKTGTEITLTATDTSGFLYWKNNSGKIVSRKKEYTFVLTGVTELTMACAGGEAAAFVEFVNDYGQVLACGTYGQENVISYPAGPSKTGYDFKGWNMTEEAVKTAIKNGESHITITPVYTLKEERYLLNVYQSYNGELLKETPETYENLLPGSVKTLTAPKLEGKQFKCWSLDKNGTTVLGTEDTYFVQMSKDTTIYAVYVDDEAVVEKKPVVVITNKYAGVTDGKHKVSFVATRDVSEGYTLLEQGMLYSADNTLTEETFILGGTNIKQYISTDTRESGVLTMNISVSSIDTVVMARAYLLVQNDSTGNTEVIYSQIEQGSFSALSSAE